MVITEVGMVIVARDEQDRKARSPIVPTEVGMVTTLKREHSAKA
jgi:hypothetical protein